jgi:hypothetical protein
VKKVAAGLQRAVAEYQWAVTAHELAVAES